jgi:hypothetical protein
MVNINEFEAPQVPSFGLLDNIFSEQHSLMEKYIGIEADNHLLHTPDCPVDLDSPKGQARLKDFAWRITEELGEALEACRVHPDLPDHNREELIDSLHFLTEFTILAGMTPQDVRNRLLVIYDDVPQTPLEHPDELHSIYRLAIVAVPRIGVLPNAPMPDKGELKILNYLGQVSAMGLLVERIAVCCNYLKNKPWKRTHMLTDKERFKDAVALVWLHFANLAAVAGLTPDDIYQLYFRKKQVNDFRIRSRY